MSDIRLLLYDTPTATLQQGGMELLDTWAEQPGNWIWADISGRPDDAERELLTERFRLSTLAVQDAHRERHPPCIRERHEPVCHHRGRSNAWSGEGDGPPSLRREAAQRVRLRRVLDIARVLI